MVTIYDFTPNQAMILPSGPAPKRLCRLGAKAGDSYGSRKLKTVRLFFSRAGAIPRRRSATALRLFRLRWLRPCNRSFDKVPPASYIGIKVRVKAADPGMCDFPKQQPLLVLRHKIKCREYLFERLIIKVGYRRAIAVQGNYNPVGAPGGTAGHSENIMPAAG